MVIYSKYLCCWHIIEQTISCGRENNVFIFSSFLYFLLAPLIPFAVLHLMRTRVWLLESLKHHISIFPTLSHYIFSTHRFFVIAVILLVTVAHSAVTPRPPHFLEISICYTILCKILFSANLRGWLVACGEGWAHEWFSPPARGLVLKMVIVHVLNEKILAQ